MLLRLTLNGDWPNCLYDETLLCGDPGTGRLTGYHSEVEGHNKSWHVADMCNCPSCPLRCAIRTALFEEKKES